MRLLAPSLLSLSVVCVLLGVAATSRAGGPLTPFPAYFALPAGFEVEPGGATSAAFGREEFRFGVPGQRDLTTTAVEGPQWHFNLKAGTTAKTKDEVLARFRQTLEPLGWALVSTPPRLMFTRSRDGKESWFELGILGPQDVRMTLIEKGTVPRALTLPEPAATAVPWKDGELPEYLVPYPGAHLAASHVEKKGGFEVTQTTDKERTWVGDPVWALRFEGPADLSVYEFDQVFCPALERAGWTLLHHTPHMLTGGDMVFLAHYAQHGRDIWMLGHMHGALEIRIADAAVAAAASALAEALAREGHIALYGLYFDLDQAALRPASEATLREVLALLDADPKLALRVEGHTDNSGTRAHNQTLSEQRAASVIAWLVQHGIAAARLTARGFADTHPVADNRSPEGRSKNRRVELAKP